MASKVVVVVQEDSAASCLPVLHEHGCQVLAVAMPKEGSKGCPIFARRCVELGFGFLSNASDYAPAVVATFKPDMVVAIVEEEDSNIQKLSPAEVPSYVLEAGATMKGAPWKEFAPIWLAWKESAARLVRDGKVVASQSIAMTDLDTASTLSMKHGDAKASLLASLLKGEELTLKVNVEASCEEEAPGSICLDWTDDKVDRYVRAHTMPPREAAKVADPATGDMYYIECMEQFQEFCKRILKEGQHEEKKVGAYAADTHWYSNVGGTIVKMGDSEIHLPTRVEDRTRPAVIPGAALSGRKKLRMNEPLIGPNAERYCSSALASGWIGVEGPHVKQFEKQLARICGCSAACAVHSGTAALYGAMKALGVEESSQHVLVPSFTCAAAADAVVHAGGLPIPVDCEMDTFGVSIEAVRAALESNPDIVGVVVAPCYGVPAKDFYEIYCLCKERGIWLCEDACESYGANQVIPDPKTGLPTLVPVGSLATLCVVSVRSEKMIGVGEGGAILGNDTTLVARAKWWCSRAPCRGVGLWRVYEHDAVGQNFRLPEMLAAVGCAAAEMLPVMKERKRNIHSWYQEGFASHPVLKRITLQKCVEGHEAVWWITAALLPDNMNGEAVGMQLIKDYPDIEIRPGFSPLSAMAIFQSQWVKACPNTEALYHGLVCLPSSHQLTKPDVDRICDALAASIEKVRASS